MSLVYANEIASCILDDNLNFLGRAAGQVNMTEVLAITLDESRSRVVGESLLFVLVELWVV